MFKWHVLFNEDESIGPGDGYPSDDPSPANTTNDDNEVGTDNDSDADD